MPVYRIVYLLNWITATLTPAKAQWVAAWQAYLSYSEFNTKPPFTLSFHGEQRGKTVYFALRWENTTGEKGPWSEIENAIIP
jgi:hypothetical protein